METYKKTMGNMKYIISLLNIQGFVPEAGRTNHYYKKGSKIKAFISFDDDEIILNYLF